MKYVMLIDKGALKIAQINVIESEMGRMLGALRCEYYSEDYTIVCLKETKYTEAKSAISTIRKKLNYTYNNVNHVEEDFMSLMMRSVDKNFDLLDEISSTYGSALDATIEALKVKRQVVAEEYYEIHGKRF